MKVSTRRPLQLPLHDVVATFGRFRPALRGQGRQMSLAVLGAAITTAMTLLRPWPITWIVDHLVLTEPGSLDMSRIIAFAAISFAVPVAMGYAQELQQMAMARVSRKATVRIRSDVFEHLQRVSMSHHAGLYSGDLQVRLMGDVNMVRDLLFPSWVNLAARLSLIAFGSIVFVFVDWRLFLVALIPLPLLWVTIDRGSQAIKQAAGKQRRKEGAIAASAGEQLRQVGLIKAFAAEERTQETFRRQSRSAERATMAAAKEAARMGRLAEVLTGFGVALVLVMGAMRVRAEVLSVGQLVLAISYTRMLYKPIRKLTTEGVRLAKAVASGRRIIELLDLPTEDLTSGVPIAGINADIVFDRVSHTYPDGRDSIHDLSFRIRAGAMTAIVGENGTGKSTIMSLLLRLHEPSGGEITVGGFPIQEIQLDSYRRNLAFVPQQLVLFGGTVRENIMFGNPDATDAELEDAIAAAHLVPVLERLPDGLHTVLDEDGSSLSGGQARRVMLARAAIRDAPILLLDEPLTGLDVEAQQVVSRAIASIGRGRTTIVVHHGDLSGLDPEYRVALDPPVEPAVVSVFT